MSFQKYSNTNLARCNLWASLWASATSVLVETGKWGLFPAANFYYRIYALDSEGRVTKQQIDYVPTRSGDTFQTVVRGADDVPASYTAWTQTNTSFAYDIATEEVWIEQVFPNIQIEDIQDEIERLETDKADDNAVVHNTGNENVDWVKTFTSSPEVPTGVNPDDAVNKAQLDADILAASAAENLNDRDNYITGEDIAEWLVNFPEPSPLIGQVTWFGGIFVNDASWRTYSNLTTQTLPQGMRMQATADLVVSSVKVEGWTYTIAYLKTDAWVIIESALLSNNIATFTRPYSFNTWTFFRIEFDRGGLSYTSRRETSVSFPIAWSRLSYIVWSQNGWDVASTAYNIVSIETQEVACQKIWDIAKNTRGSIPFIWSGVLWNTFNLALKKFVSPWVSLGIRIETDNAGEPSWTLIDPNATATIAAAWLTTTLASTLVTLAGNITVPRWDLVHAVLYAGNYGAETVNSTNYYGVGYAPLNTTTRDDLSTFNWSVWENWLWSNVVDNDNITLTTNLTVTASAWYRIQANQDLYLSVVNKNSNCTATRCRVFTDGWALLGTATFSGNIATFATPILLYRDTFYRVEADNSWANYTRRALAWPTYPQNRTNVNYNTWSVSQANDVWGYNIDSVETQEIFWLPNRFFFGNWTIFEDTVLSLASASYEYKVPYDVTRVSAETKLRWELMINNTLGINDNQTWLTAPVQGVTTKYYLQNTPWTIWTSPWSYPYPIWFALDEDKLYIGNVIGDASSYTSLNSIVASATLINISSVLLCKKDAVYTFDISLWVQGSSSLTTAAIQYSLDNTNWINMVYYELSSTGLSTNTRVEEVQFVAWRYYRTRCEHNGNVTGWTTRIDLDTINNI